MKRKVYYEIQRRQKCRFRKKLMRALRKHPFGTETILRIVDAMAGDTPYGKEKTSQELLRMLSDGAGEAELLSFADRLTRKSFLHPAVENESVDGK